VDERIEEFVEPEHQNARDGAGLAALTLFAMAARQREIIFS
jgi:hypothetical protein